MPADLPPTPPVVATPYYRWIALTVGAVATLVVLLLLTGIAHQFSLK